MFGTVTSDGAMIVTISNGNAKGSDALDGSTYITIVGYE